MRNNRKRAGLFLALLIGAIALVSWCRRDRTGEVSTSRSTSANGVASTSTAEPRSSGPGTEPYAQAGPPAVLPPGGVAQVAQSVAEAPRSGGAEVAQHATRGGAQAKAVAPSKAKRRNTEPPKAAAAVANSQPESSDRASAATHPEQAPEAAQPAQPPKETGMLIGSIQNSVGSTFRLTKIAFYLDGAQVAAQDYPGGLEPNARLQILERRVDPGHHTLGALVEYQGNGGVLSYFEGYRYKVTSSHDFTATADGTTQITLVPYEKGNLLTSFENRLGVAFRVRSVSGQ
jgi:hypothetical protein